MRKLCGLKLQILYLLLLDLGEFLPETYKLLFVLAKLFFTVGAAEISVGFFRESLGGTIERQFPPERQYECRAEKHPAVPSLDEEQRRKHHGIVPVVDPACGAALIMQEPALERAEEQYADKVAY